MYPRVVRSSVRLLVTLVHPSKAVERNEMPFGRGTRVVPSNIVLEGGPPARNGRNPQSKFALQIAAKPLQIAEWLLYTTNSNSATPYKTVPSPTP